MNKSNAKRPSPKKPSRNEKQSPEEKVQKKSDAKSKEPKVEKVSIFLPDIQPLQGWKEQDKTLVVCFDTESAFGNEISELYQIGALVNEQDQFSINILPVGQIHWGVVKYAGTNVSTEIDKTTKRKYLWHSKQRKELDTVSPEKAWSLFISWISALKSKHGCDKLILAAHGSLDAPALLNNLAHYGHLNEFLKHVDAFCDTLGFVKNKVMAAFERLYPNEMFEAHNALEDAFALHKILLKRAPDSSCKKLTATKEILANSTSMANALELAEFKVSKMVQALTKPEPGIHYIKDLSQKFDLPKVEFINKKAKAKKELLQISLPNATLIGLDVQFIESQGIRSEIVEMSAQVLFQEDLKGGNEFHVQCYSFYENEASMNGFRSNQEGLHLFLDWLSSHQNVILVMFKPMIRAWPNLINHVYFYGLQARFFTTVKGLACFQSLVQNSGKAHGKCESIEKIWRQLSKSPDEIHAHRSRQVLRTMVTIVQDYLGQDELQKSYDKCFLTSTDNLAKVKRDLDNSLAEDITVGKYFPSGHIGNFRMPENYFLSLPASCN